MAITTIEVTVDGRVYLSYDAYYELQRLSPGDVIRFRQFRTPPGSTLQGLTGPLIFVRVEYNHLLFCEPFGKESSILLSDVEIEFLAHGKGL